MAITLKEEMGVQSRGKGNWSSMVCFMVIQVLAISAFTEESTVLASAAACFGNKKSQKLISHQHARRKLDDIGGSISIDCGLPVDFSDTGDITDIRYESDEEFISTGVNKSISSKFRTATLPRSLENVRSFPRGDRNCYTLRPPEGSNTIYLIRASFMYGDYDDEDKLPEFDLYVGVNQWDTVRFDNASQVVITEIIYLSLMDEIYVCLLNIGKGTPFISGLEVRHFHNTIYRTQLESALVLYRRLDVGSTTNQTIRYKDDSYDRMWFPYLTGYVSINNPFSVDSLVESEYRLPSKVMKTAVKPENVNDSLEFIFETGDPSLEYYVYMHFAELESLQANQYREFSIKLNDNLWEKSVVPKYLYSTTITSKQPMRGTSLRFSLQKASNCSLPPILNAMEIYVRKDFKQASTEQEDVNAIMDIKSRYQMSKSWQGDPCAPIYSWDGLNCSYNGYDSPKIISLNLSSKGLAGNIPPSLSNLKSLRYLDLSNNSLTGSIPDFLSQLPRLSILNLDKNKLSGSVPMSLMAKSHNGSLLLSVNGNPDLCLLAPCKKAESNIVVPLVAAIVSALVIIFIAFLIILWSYRRKQAAKPGIISLDKREGSLKSDSRQFTYSEIVNITNNFNRVLGKGGFGTVYHGYLVDGTQVAIKMLTPTSSQASTQFRTEAQFLIRVHHRNLAALVGYCNDSRNFAIVYEYMAYGNLEEYLLDKSKEALSWKERLQIAVDAAQGLEYLHHGCKTPIIHRDVKTANILLTEKLQAKIADFGFSKFFPIESGSHILTSVVGTVGYLDPEYYACNRLGEKSDVYSFGVVLLELITGQPAVIRGNENNVHIIQWVSPFLAGGDIISILDPRLEGNFDTNSVWTAVETAMECLPPISIQRPTMSHVVVQLKECLDMEIAREKALQMESQMMGSNNSVEMSPVDLETDMGPEPR